MRIKYFLTGLAMIFVSFFSTNFIQTAHAISIDFESLGGYDLFYGAALTTDQAHSATHSVNLSDPTAVPTVRINPSALNLGTTSGSFWSYIPGSSNTSVAPYMIFGVDVNKNGDWDYGASGDAMVIAFITGASPYPANTWFLSGLDAGTKVHVGGNRLGLTAGTFDSSGTQDTLAALSAISTGGGLWGDLALLRIYVEIGLWDIDSYTAYVDDIQVNTVPEPSTMLLLGSGLLGLALKRITRPSER